MPRGFSGVRSTSADIESRRSSGGLNALWFRLQDGETATVRFLEENDDIFWCWMHEVPVEGRAYGRDEPCCNQDNDDTPCPGCEADIQRKFKGFINLIWDEAPVWKRDNEGKMVKDDDNKPIKIGEKPQVAVWGSGIRVFEELDEVNANYRGLRSRKFKVKRKGVKLSTKYTISPADVDGGPQPFTESEKELESKKYDLHEFTKPMSYEALQAKMGGGDRNNNNNGGGEQQGQIRKNPFLRK
jgi:hypothetical protein